MATHVCPEHITKLFDGGKAPREQKFRAQELALEWIKSQLPTLHPRDTIMVPHPDTGELEPWGKSDEPFAQ